MGEKNLKKLGSIQYPQKVTQGLTSISQTPPGPSKLKIFFKFFWWDCNANYDTAYYHQAKA